MALHILAPVKGGGRLGQVLNSYLHGLRSLEQVTLPSLSMATLATWPEENTAYMGELLYYLTATTSALHQLANRLLDAYFELETFVEEGSSDLAYYVAYKQREAAEEAGRARKKLSKLAVKPTDLTPYQLHVVLAPCFVGYPGVGERIGSSRAVDYAVTSNLFSNELEHGLRDPGQPATPANLTTSTPDERRALNLPAKKPGRRWVGCDISLTGPALVTAFDQLLQECQQAAAYYHSLAPTDAEGFTELYRLISSIIDGDKLL